MHLFESVRGTKIISIALISLLYFARGCW